MASAPNKLKLPTGRGSLPRMRRDNKRIKREYRQPLMQSPVYPHVIPDFLPVIKQEVPYFQMNPTRGRFGKRPRLKLSDGMNNANILAARRARSGLQDDSQTRVKSEPKDSPRPAIGQDKPRFVVKEEPRDSADLEMS